MVLVGACIAPHGSEIVPEFRHQGKNTEMLAKSMSKIAEYVKQAKPDTIVVATPHNVRLSKNVAIIATEYASGVLKEGKIELKLELKCDTRLAEEVLNDCNHLQVEKVIYGTQSGKLSCIQLDWGSFVPLWFFVKKNSIKTRILLISPSREVSNDELYRFGSTISSTLMRDKKRVFFVASADQAHTHSKKGPYGYSRYARIYDELVISMIKENRLSDLVNLDKRIVERAKPDSFWQMLILAPIIKESNMSAEFLSYGIQEYYSMLCVLYRKK